MKKLLKVFAAVGMSSVMMLGILQICDAPQGRMFPGTSVSGSYSVARLDSVSTCGEIIVFPLAELG